MEIKEVFNLLNNYYIIDGKEKAIKQSFIELVTAKSQKSFSYKEKVHITCSGLIFNKSFDKILLVFHKKLNFWVQPGGHLKKSDIDCQQAVYREVLEETGLSSLQFISRKIFDIDIHKYEPINKKNIHIHYDLRFLMIADENHAIHISNESKNIGWFCIDDFVKNSAMSNKLKRKLLIVSFLKRSNLC